jgi:hypothetical protein
MSELLVVALIGSVTTVLSVLGFYVLCAYVVRITGGTSGLRDLAVAIRAFTRRRDGHSALPRRTARRPR